MKKPRRRCLGAIFLLLFAPWLGAQEAGVALVDDKDIQVSRQGEGWLVEGSFTVPVAPAVAWVVLTDFDHMGRFLTNLSVSQVLERQGNVLQVEQRGTARFGLFSFKFQSLREITLTPVSHIHARGLSGNIKHFISDLSVAEEGSATRLTYRAEMEPDFWLPSLLGPSLLRHEMAEQFSAMVAEMLRRAGRN